MPDFIEQRLIQSDKGVKQIGLRWRDNQDGTWSPVNDGDMLMPSQSIAANATTSTVTLAINATGPGLVQLAGHGLVPGQSLFLTTSGALPTGLAAGSVTTNNYYVADDANYNANQFALCRYPGGPSIVFSGTQSGTQTLNRISTFGPFYGGVLDCQGYGSAAFQITSAGTSCTITYEQSEDGQNWVNDDGYMLNGARLPGAASTTAGIYQLTARARFKRARLSTWTSGTVTVTPALHRAQGGFVGNMLTVAGYTAHAAANGGNPLKLGGRARNAVMTAVTNDQISDLVATLDGRLVVVADAPSDLTWQYAAASTGIVNSTADVAIKAAAGAGVRNFLKSLDIMAEALATATELVVKDGATVIYRTKLTTAGLPGGRTVVFDPPLRGTANTALNVALITASATGAVYVNATGFTAA